MAPWWVFLALFAGLSKTSLQENLWGYSFVFSQKGYVTLQADQPQGLLQNVTVCLCSFSDSPSQQALFSYATKDQDKEILISKVYSPANSFWWYTVHIGGVPQRFRVADSYQDWQRICIRWASETGVLAFQLNGVDLARKVVRQGYFIKPHALIQLGRAHHEDIFFHGEIQQVNMWNTTGNNHSSYNPAMIRWSDLSYETQGNVVLDYLASPSYKCQNY
ncbi:mucosal pentraxin-like isoform X2 [Erythrolamprus reginae]|uniref:mucosal pentraxin-like isoform X2 n=1 Tax=Erythrolamprus reginae TaxID=121349 RepID=UPI00396C9ACF